MKAFFRTFRFLIFGAAIMLATGCENVVNSSTGNNPPVASDFTISTDDANPSAGFLIATDADGNPLTYWLVANGTNGTVELTSPPSEAYIYTSNAGFNGQDTFTYVAHDGAAYSNTGVVTVYVNASPTVDYGYYTSDGTPTLITVTTSPDAISLSVVSGPGQGSVTTPTPAGTGVFTFTYTPVAGAAGLDSIDLVANDGFSDSNSPTTIWINVDAVPTANDLLGLTTDDNTTLTGTLTGFDPANEALTFAIVAQPAAGGTVILTPVSNSTADFTWNPPTNYSTPVGTWDSFTFQVTDPSSNKSNIATVEFFVDATPVPVDQLSGLVIDDANSLGGTLTSTDVENDPTRVYTLQAAPNAALGNVTVNSNGSYTFTSVSGASGTATFTFSVADSVSDSFTNGAVATGTVNILVNPSPVGDPQTISTGQDSPKGGTLTATDPDGYTGPFTFQADATSAQGGTVVLAGASFTYTPPAGYTGTDSFTFQVMDDLSWSNTRATITINVSAAPTASNGTLTTDDGTAKSGTLVASGGTGTYTYSIVAQPPAGQGSVVIDNPATGAYTFTPDAAYPSGTTTFDFKANDGVADSNIATITVTINATPVANAQSITTGEDVVFSGTLTSTNPEVTDTLTYAVSTPAGSGTVNITDTATGAFTYTPNSGTAGGDSFAFTVDDGVSTSTPATVTVTVVAQPEVFPAYTWNTGTTTWDPPVALPAGWADGGGAAPWTIVTTPVYEGTHAVRSGAIADSQTSILDYTVTTTEAGEIQFAAYVDSDPGDVLNFYIDSGGGPVLTRTWDGTTGWFRAAFPTAGAGTYTFTWEYAKDGVPTGSAFDAAVIDQAEFVGVSALPPGTGWPGGGFPAGYSTPGGTVAWLVDGTTVFEGADSMSSGVTADGGTSALQGPAAGLAGEVSFAVRTDTDAGDVLTFSINGVPVQSWEGFNDWATYSFPISAGQVPSWEYTKDGIAAVGTDTVWIDDVIIP